MKYPLACLLLCLTLAACEEETLTPSVKDTLETYYPLELNRPAYYTVDSIVLVPTISGIVYDTATLEARETLLDSYVGADGKTVYRGERWERPDADARWTFKQTFTVTADGGAYRRSEDNLTFTKLVAPLRSGLTWDGNAAFSTDRDVTVGPEFLDVYNGWEYRYGNTEETLTLPTGLTLDSVVTVEQAAVENLIELRTAYERYAPGLGLVERYIDARHTQCVYCCDRNTDACLDLPWNEKAEKGMILHQTLVRRE